MYPITPANKRQINARPLFQYDSNPPYFLVCDGLFFTYFEFE
jgi:hypothetical protein